MGKVTKISGLVRSIDGRTGCWTS